MYPYFLPCFISGVIALGGAVLGYFCMEEVLTFFICLDVYQVLIGFCAYRPSRASVEHL